MQSAEKAKKIELFRFDTPQMRAFHMTWLAFFVCFFAWFAIAPLMTIVRGELKLSPEQVRWCIAASVAATVVARLLVGWLCDRVGPRLTYSWLLVLGALPVMGIGLADRFETFLIFRLLIGMIGASFVITQFHTSAMFAPNCVGTANATTAGWGNLGGGVTQFVMPILATLLAGTLGLGESLGWRVAMVIAGSLLLVMGVAYYFLTQDCPAGNFADLRAKGQLSGGKARGGSFLSAAADYRVWALALAYAACFGMELTMDNVAHTYFVDNFGLSVKSAGFAAGAFGLMNLFARALGGYIADWFGLKWHMQGRVSWLFIALFCEGLALVLFSQMRRIELAIPAMLLAGLFVKMSNGATYAIVPLINPKSLGSTAGIVGAGGNLGAVAMALFLGGRPEAWPASFLILGSAIVLSSFFVLVLQRSGATEAEAGGLAAPNSAAPALLPEPAPEANG